MTIALAAATVMLVLAVGSLIVLVIQRNFQGEPMHNREAFHAARNRPSVRNRGSGPIS